MFDAYRVVNIKKLKTFLFGSHVSNTTTKAYLARVESLIFKKMIPCSLTSK